MMTDILYITPRPPLGTRRFKDLFFQTIIT